ncbi:hypothetical protein GCM10009841_07070 [Microlunatus panaciterrae]|uniref:Membrane protein n=1 Tax=Microlunatus panaciterrae TaxID=400768 RepID=A0ABS2RI11_9ACTN|nr:PH domain-containing protein [Microlunatus panaciterrae]MBM7798640.1 putative membrane protein [Microlunatus panaciterrae]
MSETPSDIHGSDVDQATDPIRLPNPAPSAQQATAAAGVKQTERPHPLTPFIRGWVVLVAVVLGFGREMVPDGSNDRYQVSDLHWILPLVAVAVVFAGLAGFINWYFTRFVIDDEELRIETGALFKNSKRISFERLQSIDVLQPLAARMFGLAELRLEVGAGDSTTKLRYLSRSSATQLRDYLLARAHGERTSVADTAARPPASPLTDLSTAERPLVTISPQRLVGGFLLSSDWLLTVGAVLVLFVVTTVFQVVPYALPGLIPLVIGGLSMISRRVFAQFNFTLAESGRGLRVSRGLTNLASQSVPVDRIQGLRISQSILWRPFDWYRVDVDILGYGSQGGDDNQSDATSVLLPVATTAELRVALRRVLPGVDLDAVVLERPPRRVRWIRPFDGWTLRYGYDDRVIVSEHGWLIHHRNVVPHAKTQSVRIEQGPLQRSMSLASVHVDTPKGPVNLVAQHLAVSSARRLALTQLDRAATARRAATPAPRHTGTDPTLAPFGDEETVLARFGIGTDQFLGAGGESRVFALDDSRVLRLYHADSDQRGSEPTRHEEALASLYRGWAGVDIGLELPQILEVGQLEGRRFSIDRRMSGRDFSGWLASAPEGERRIALDSFLDAALALQGLPLPAVADAAQPAFARLLGDEPRRFASLADLLDSQLELATRLGFVELRHELPHADHVLARLRRDIAERVCRPALVHGDLGPGNAYVSRRPDGSVVVTGIGDFSPHTLAADPLMDVTGAIAFLELEHYPGADADAQWLLQVARERLGDDIAHWVDVYRRFYAVYYSMDPAVHPWSLRQLRGR